MIAWFSHAWTALVSFVGHLNEGELRFYPELWELRSVL